MIGHKKFTADVFFTQSRALLRRFMAYTGLALRLRGATRLPVRAYFLSHMENSNEAAFPSQDTRSRGHVLGPFGRHLAVGKCGVRARFDRR